MKSTEIVEKNKRKRLAASEIQCQLLIAKFLIIIFESADLHFLNYYYIIRHKRADHAFHVRYVNYVFVSMCTQ